MTPPLPYQPGTPAPPPPKKSLASGAAGRPAGAANKVTRALKDAILYAAAEAGDRFAEQALKDQGREIEGGLAGYLTVVATTDVKSFCALLGRVLPLQLTGEDGGPLTVTFKTVYEEMPPMKVVSGTTLPGHG